MAADELARHERAAQCQIQATCVVCGTEFSYLKAGPGRLRRFCGPACKVARAQKRVAEAACLTCGRPYRPRYRSAGFCSLDCRQYPERRKWPTMFAGRRAAHDRRRARLASVEFEAFTRAEIYERDGWRCGICGEVVEAARKLPDPMSPSLDHIIPVAKGGGHTRDNVQLAHWICNTRKGVRAGLGG